MSQTPSVEEIRAMNGFKVLVAAFLTVLISFVAAIWFWSGHLGSQGKVVSSDIVALMGVMTGIVGALVGSYFGITSANSAKDSINAQLTSAASARDVASAKLSAATSLNTKLSGALEPDTARQIMSDHAASLV
ncbi:MAG: hypothetical protein NVSMB5_16350 [Candidatus Velthaea sp.]